MRGQLRLLQARLLEVREQERAHLSRRVHDELGQALTALQWDVAKLTEQWQAPGAEAPESTAQRLASMAATIAGALHTVRTVATELRPPMLDQFGLSAAIRWQADEFQNRYGILCEVDSDRDCSPSPCVATALFRIFQETLTNVARHAAANRVRIRLFEFSGRTTLSVQDDGKGMPEGKENGSLGILGMRERARLVGGSVEIASGTGSGTTVTVQIPSQMAAGEEEEPLGIA